MVSRTKKIIKAEDWEKLAAEYNDQAAENNFVQRTSTQCQNRILNLKDTYRKMKDQQGKPGESYRADKENNDFPNFEIMDRILCDKQSCNPQYIYDPGRFKLKEKSSKLSEQYARLSDEEEYSDINVSVNDSDVGIHDKTVTPPLLESSMAKEKVRNKREHLGCQETAKEVQTGKGRCSEFTDKSVQIIEDSKKRDEDMFTNFFDFVSASEK